MKTRTCPFCGKEISEEAILCKFCHNLLIDENGKDIEPQYEEPEQEQPAEEENTIVYSKEELKKAMEQAKAESADPDEIVAEAEQNLEEAYEEQAESPEEVYDDTVYNEDADDEGEAYTYDDEYGDGSEEGEYEEGEYAEEEYADGEYAEEEYPEGEYAEGEYPEEEYQPEEYEPAQPENATLGEYDPKRTFLITAIITLGILIIIIAAVAVGYKLFGFGSDDSSSSAAPVTVTQGSTDTATATEPVTTEYVPQVTDDTASENPTDIADSLAADPVTDSTIDSAADSMADSSAADSTADSSADSSAADSSSAADENSSLAGPEGGYYSWNEATAIWQSYASSNGLTDGGYAYGTDGVEMNFYGTDSDGVTHTYRVDLVTGAISQIG